MGTGERGPFFMMMNGSLKTTADAGTAEMPLYRHKASAKRVAQKWLEAEFDAVETKMVESPTKKKGIP